MYYKNENEKLKIDKFVPVPQEWFDKIVPSIDHRKERQRLLVEIFLLRQTVGFQKLEDRVSYSQFQNGIVNRNTGKHLNYGCGYQGRASIKKGIEQVLKARTFIKGDVNHQGTLYKINTDLFPSIQNNHPRYEDNTRNNKKVKLSYRPDSKNSIVPTYGEITYPTSEKHNNIIQNKHQKGSDSEWLKDKRKNILYSKVAK